MKNVIVFILLLASANAYSQFGPQLILDTTIFGFYANDIELSDMNNDGYLDVLVANQGTQGNVSIYLNNTIGGFAPKNVISTNLYPYNSLVVEDFNADGWMDVVAMSKIGKVTKFESNLGTSYSQMDIDSGIFFPFEVRSGDFDLNGTMDYVSLADIAITSQLNDGLANFTKDTVANFTEYYSFCTGDINGDGFDDIISGSVGLFTFINDGDGTFTRVTTNEALINQIITVTEFADMDNDGDLDLVVYYTNTSDKVDWFSNDGSGVFTLESSITSVANNIHQISLGDVDNDGDIDLVMDYDQINQLGWIENFGNGSFSSEQIITSNILNSFRSALGDFDNDGDLDLTVNSSPGLNYYINSTILTGLNEISNANVNWFPNPVARILNIEVSENAIISIYNMMGQLVENSTLHEGTNTLGLDLAPGNYVVQISTSKGISREKLSVLQ